MRVRLVPISIVLLLAASVVAACGGGGSGSSGTSPGGGGAQMPAHSEKASASGSAGSLIITKPEGLVEYNIDDKTSKTVVAAPPNTFLLDPAASPDGTQIAYVLQPPPTVVGAKYDGGTDIWVVDRDGSNAHPVFTHAVANQQVRFPKWEDYDHILAVVQEISDTGAATIVTYALERIDIADGERTKLQEGVISFGLSPDSKRAVYALLAPQTGETLMAVDLAGGTPATLVGLDQNLSPFNSPRYSPDGATVAFASADQTAARAGFEYVTARGFGPAPRSALDGLPEDIWTVDANGGLAQRVADLKEDLPALAWSGDGKHIYVVGASALYDVNLANGAVDRIGEGSFHGQLVWLP